MDNDGDADLVVTHLVKPASLLRNDSERSGGSVRVKLIGTRSPRQAQGVRVEAVVSGKRLSTHVPAGGSFQSTSDVRVIFAVGDATLIDECVVHWGDGNTEVWTNLPVRAELVLVEGTGAPGPQLD